MDDRHLATAQLARDSFKLTAAGIAIVVLGAATIRLTADTTALRKSLNLHFDYQAGDATEALTIFLHNASLAVVVILGSKVPRTLRSARRTVDTVIAGGTVANLLLAAIVAAAYPAEVLTLIPHALVELTGFAVCLAAYRKPTPRSARKAASVAGVGLLLVAAALETLTSV